MGPSVQDWLAATLTQELKPDHHDEVWGINMVGNSFRTDLIFWMDDLEQQAALTPHLLVPSAGMKALFNGDIGKIESIKDLVQVITELPDMVPLLDHQSLANRISEFFRLPPGSATPVAVLAAIQNVLTEDLRAAVPDKSRSLAGLIKVLDSHKTPVYTSIRRPELVENSLDYPLDEVSSLGFVKFGKPYLTNGVAMAVAYAMLIGVEELMIYGCDFTYPNRNFAEAGRACVEAWCCYALEKGMRVNVSPSSSLFDTHGDPGIYGYATQPVIDLPNGDIIQYRRASEVVAAPPPKPYVPEDSSGVKHVLPSPVESNGTRRPESLRGRNGAGSDGGPPKSLWRPANGSAGAAA